MTQKRADFDYRYSIIPGGAVTDKRLSLRDLQVLALLGRHTNKKGWCFRSQVEMAKEIECGRATVSRSIKRLIDAGWLEAKPLPRGRTTLKEGEQPFSANMYRVKIDRDDEEDVELAVDVPKNGHPPVNGKAVVPKNGQEVPIVVRQGVSTQVGTHRRTNLKDQLNALRPADAVESEKAASLSEGSPERWPEFRTAVTETWPGGFPADNEVAGRKAWDGVTRAHDPDLVIACARLHGAAKTAAKNNRNGKSPQHMRLPANWLKDGDWQGYIPKAKAAVAEEAAMVTALGNVRRALGNGLFELLRRVGMPDASLAMLDGIGHAPPAHFTIIRPFQRTLVDRYEPQIRRHTGSDLSFTLMPKAEAS